MSYEISSNATRNHSNQTESFVGEETLIKTTLASLICSTGLLGNAATIILMLRHKRMRRPINWLVFNLAIVNLAIVLITIPYDIIHEKIDWPFGDIGCKYLVMPVMEHFAAVSVLTHTAVGVARYLTIRKSGRGYNVVTNKFTMMLIFLIWIISFLVLSVTLMGILGKFKLHRPEGRLLCELYWISQDKRKTYRICVFVLTYVIPTTMTGFSYQRMHHVVVRSLRTVHNHLAPDLFLSRRQKHQRMNKTFMTMFILFTLTTFPLQLFLFLNDFKLLPWYPNARLTFHVLLILFYAQVVINPFVLFYMSEEYRKEVCCCAHQLDRRCGGSTRTAFSMVPRLNSVNMGSTLQLNRMDFLDNDDESQEDSSIQTTCV